MCYTAGETYCCACDMMIHSLRQMAENRAHAVSYMSYVMACNLELESSAVEELLTPLFSRSRFPPLSYMLSHNSSWHTEAMRAAVWVLLGVSSFGCFAMVAPSSSGGAVGATAPEKVSTWHIQPGRCVHDMHDPGSSGLQLGRREAYSEHSTVGYLGVL